MLILSLLSLLIIHIACQNAIPSDEEISHIIFLEDKLFYTTQSKKYFGFISAHNGDIMTLEEVKENEEILRVDQKFNKLFLRKNKHQVVIFRLNSLEINELRVQIKFQHQRIVDVVQTEQKLYVLTNKDLRVHNLGEHRLFQNPKNIVSSCKKSQHFLKIFIEDQTIIIALLKNDQELCLRQVFLGKKAEQKCFFNISSEVVQIVRIKDAFLIQCKHHNYVINRQDDVYTFAGQLIQVDNLSVTLEQQKLRTFDFKDKVFLEGLHVHGSQDRHLWLATSQSGSFILAYNKTAVRQFGQEQRPLRMWMHLDEDKTIKLMVLFVKHTLKMYSMKADDSQFLQLWPLDERKMFQSEGEL